MPKSAVAATVTNPLGVSAAEWETRVDLAAIYHLLQKYRMTDLTNQYCVARIKDKPNQLLMKHYGLLNEEVTASGLIRVDLDGNVLDTDKGEPNPAGIAISAAIFRARPDVGCILHIHTKAIMGVSALKSGLLPLSQAAFIVHDQVTYSRYVFDHHGDCPDNLVRILGDKKIIIESNHGVFVVGSTVAEAFFLAFYLNQACDVQLTVQMTGQEVIMPEPVEVEQFNREMYSSPDYQYDGSREWSAMRRALDRESPSYKT